MPRLSNLQGGSPSFDADLPFGLKSWRDSGSVNRVAIGQRGTRMACEDRQQRLKEIKTRGKQIRKQAEGLLEENREKLADALEVAAEHPAGK
jgi:hypothetical protein